MIGRLFALAVWTTFGAGLAHAEYVGMVSKIYDGDTFGLCDDTHCVRIRICGIDAPEVGASGADAATNALTKLVSNGRVRCKQVGEGTVCDGRSRPTNRNRIVAQCFVNDADIAASLVAGGFACDWVKFSGGAYGGIPCP